jgi:preprotein translocase subunit SecE
MNRQTKRLMARQEAAKQRSAPPQRRPQPGEQQRKKRTPPRQFLKEVRQELKKVNWPTRKELWSYFVVVLVSVVILTTYVAGLDYGVAKAVLKIFT